MKKQNYFYKNDLDLQRMRYAGKVVSIIIKTLKKMIIVNNTSLMLAKKARQIIKENQCEPNFLNYYGFPDVICVSVNQELIHGIPNNRPFQENDLVSIDVGCKYQGMHADCAASFIVGEGDQETKDLLQTTYQALMNVKQKFLPMMKFNQIGKIIEDFVTKKGYFLTPDYCGHGIGRKLHEKPNIFNVYRSDCNLIARPRMTFCVEPMVLIGSSDTKILKDKWTVVSDNSRKTCHFEHTFLVTKNGIEILTNWEN